MSSKDQHAEPSHVSTSNSDQGIASSAPPAARQPQAPHQDSHDGLRVAEGAGGGGGLRPPRRGSLGADEREIAAAARLAECLDLLDQGRQGVSSLPSLGADEVELPEWIALRHLVHDSAPVAAWDASRHARVWDSIAQATAHRELPRPVAATRSGWAFWRWIALTTAAACALLLSITTLLPDSTPSPTASASYEVTPETVVRLDGAQARFAAEAMRADQDPPGDTRLRAWRQARFAAWRHGTPAGGRTP